MRRRRLEFGVGLGVLLLLALALVTRGGDGSAASPPPQAARAAQAPVVAAAAPPVVAETSPPAAPAAAADAEVPVVEAGGGTLVTVPGSGPRSGTGPLRRFTVQVEQGLGVDAAAFAAEVEHTLSDPRSWGAGGRLSFQRVDSGPVEVRVVLASPATTDRLCRPLDTAGIYSCGVGSTAVINSMRWLRGADAYAGDLASYRLYVVNHEVGHTLGHGHQGCPGAGRPAPVMMQQTKGVGACRPAPWPFA